LNVSVERETLRVFITVISVIFKPSKTEFLIFGLPQQLSKLNNPTIYLPNNVILSPIDSARNLGVIFDKNLLFAQHISSISKSCFLNIRDLDDRNTIDQAIACIIATSLIHSEIDYCNSLLLNLPATQTNRLQLVLDSAARAFTKTPKCHHITPIHLILTLPVLLHSSCPLQARLLQLSLLSPTTNIPTASNSKFTRQSRHKDSSFLPYQSGT